MQNNNITLRQARLQGREGLWQLTIENGRFSRIEPQDTATLPLGEVLDAEGGLAIPCSRTKTSKRAPCRR